MDSYVPSAASHRKGFLMCMNGEDNVYELVEQVRNDLNDVLSTVWEATHDKELWVKILKIASNGDEGSSHRGIENLLDAILEEAGVEFCEDCGERVQDCTCEDEDNDEADEAETVEA